MLPLRPPPEPRRPKPVTPAPAWVALASAWVGLFTLLGSLALPFVPGGRHPRPAIGPHPYAPADRFILLPVYGSVTALFLGIVTLWQMRRERRPLPDGMLIQRFQAWVGIVLALLGVVFFYAYVLWFQYRPAGK